MRPITDIRRERLADLIREFSEGNSAAFSRLIGRSRAQVGFWTAKPGKPGAKNLSHATARALERQFNKPHGWMDAEIGGETAPSHPGRPDDATMSQAVELLHLMADARPDDARFRRMTWPLIQIAAKAIQQAGGNPRSAVAKILEATT